MFRLRRQSVYTLVAACLIRLGRSRIASAIVVTTSLAILGASLNLVGCAKIFAQYGSLYDAGIIPVSTDNPYLAANSFIAQEMERSSFLSFFIQEKGAPHAIQIRRSGKNLSMYYPKLKQVYLASKSSAGSATRQWLITGPFNMSRPDFLEIRRLKLDLRHEPALFFASNVRDSGGVIGDGNPAKIQPKIVVVHPTPTPTPKKKRKRVAKASSASSDSATAGQNASGVAVIATPKPNADQQAIALSKNFARRALNGDLIHQVNFDGESLESIASWYTGAVGNLGAISSANKLEPGHKLKRGESILIPVNLVKTLVRKDK